MAALAETLKVNAESIGLEGEEYTLEDLLALARDKDVGARNTLTEILGGLYFDRYRVGDPERALMTQILGRLIGEVERTVRRSLADRLAGEPDAPRELINALANDTIEVARPILMRSRVLDDAELIDIIRRRTIEHRTAIARRGVVSETISEALVEQGEETVIETLLGNQGARISKETLASLVEASKEVEIFRAPLLHRADLTPRLAKRMYWWVSAALRAHIAANFDIDSTELDSKIVSSVRDLLGVGGDDELPMDGLDELAQKLHDRGAISTELLIETLRQREVSLFEALFARLAGLKKPLVRRFIFESGGEGLAIACKAVNIYKGDFTTIFLLSRAARPGDHVVDPHELSRAVNFFDRITGDLARKVVRRWRLDPDYLDALRRMRAARMAETKAGNEIGAE